MKRSVAYALTVIVLLAWVLVSIAAEPVMVVGHKNPDTDSDGISAIALANLKTQQGIPAIPIAQGPPNPETMFVLEAFKLHAPTIQTSVAGRRVIRSITPITLERPMTLPRPKWSVWSIIISWAD